MHQFKTSITSWAWFSILSGVLWGAGCADVSGDVPPPAAAQTFEAGSTLNGPEAGSTFGGGIDFPDELAE